MRCTPSGGIPFHPRFRVSGLGEFEEQHREAVAAVAEVRRAVGAVEGYSHST